MDAWTRLRRLFDTDDGGLYDVEVADLDPSGVQAAFEFIRSHSTITPDALFWHTALERDEKVADHADAAGMVTRGAAEAFHVLAKGLTFLNATIPDLGVFVWPDGITLDYRMGPEWGPMQLAALFELLRQLVSIAGGRVGLGRHAVPHVNVEFVEEFERYQAGCDVSGNRSPTDG